MRPVDQFDFDIEDGGKCVFVSIKGSPLTVRMDDIDLEHLLEKVIQTLRTLEGDFDE